MEETRPEGSKITGVAPKQINESVRKLLSNNDGALVLYLCEIQGSIPSIGKTTTTTTTLWQPEF